MDSQRTQAPAADGKSEGPKAAGHVWSVCAYWPGACRGPRSIQRTQAPGLDSSSQRRNAQHASSAATSGA